MKSSLFSLLLLFSFNANLMAQSDCDCYERLRALSDYYTAIEKHDLALEMFNKAMSNKEKILWNRFDMMKLAWKHLNVGDFAKAKEQLVNSLKMGTNLSYMEKSDKAIEFRKSQEWKELQEQLPELKREYQANLNLKYRLAIEEIYGIDGALRTFLAKDIPDSLWTKIDTVNLNKVKDLIAEYGYPHPQKHGFIGAELYVFFLHASVYSEEVYQEILTILEDAQGDCLATRRNIALIIDRREVWIEEAPQIYGLWNSWEDKGKYSPIKNLDKVDELRFEYNLLRLEEQSKIDNRALPEDYQPISYPSDYFCGYDFED